MVHLSLAPELMYSFTSLLLSKSEPQDFPFGGSLIDRPIGGWRYTGAIYRQAHWGMQIYGGGWGGWRYTVGVGATFIKGSIGGWRLREALIEGLIGG